MSLIQRATIPVFFRITLTTTPASEMLETQPRLPVVPVPVAPAPVPLGRHVQVREAAAVLEAGAPAIRRAEVVALVGEGAATTALTVAPTRQAGIALGATRGLAARNVAVERSAEGVSAGMASGTGGRSGVVAMDTVIASSGVQRQIASQRPSQMRRRRLGQPTPAALAVRAAQLPLI